MALPVIEPDIDQPGGDAGDTIGGRLVRARKAKGLTVSQLARGLGIKTQTLQGWETDRSSPRSNRLAMLAGVLNVSPAWVLTGRGEAPLPNGDVPTADSREGLLRLRDSIKAKIVELNQILDEVDSKLEQ